MPEQLPLLFVTKFTPFGMPFCTIFSLFSDVARLSSVDDKKITHEEWVKDKKNCQIAP